MRKKLVKIIAKLLGFSIQDLSFKKAVIKDTIELNGNKVVYGRYKGLVLPTTASWGGYDEIPRRLGFYEQQVQEFIFEMGNSGFNTFIDIGAADGYHLIGAARSGLFDRLFAFEIEAKSRKSIKRSIKVNSVTNCQIYGRADFTALLEIIETHPKSLILVDIEGAEYDLFDLNNLKELDSCSLIIELHPWLTKDGYVREEQLISALGEYFCISRILSDNINYREYKELLSLKESEALLATSEGRRCSQYWLLCTPKPKI